FFQAEDGIRDRTVTGVQTCALPIFAGGDGALVTATLLVTPDEALGVDVGGAGASGTGNAGLVIAGGVNGGGNGFDSGGGGGATEIGRASCRERVEGGGADGRGDARE